MSIEQKTNVRNNEQWENSRRSLLLFSFFILHFSFFLCSPAFAQNKTVLPEELWVCPVFESAYYGPSHIAIGYGGALGYGDRVAFGLKVLYWNDLHDTRSLELNLLARFYLFALIRPTATGASGLFIQLNGGPVIFARHENRMAMPSEVGTFSAGLSLGWRFVFIRRIFIEPAIRAGYPYVIGAGVSAGVRF